MSPAEYIYVEDHRKFVMNGMRLDREQTLHRWVAEGKVGYNVTYGFYTVGCKAHEVRFKAHSYPDDGSGFPSARFIADLALAIQSISCVPAAPGVSCDG